MCTLEVAVDDTGVGIPGEKLDTMFEESTQADASATREYGGTGLGLAISKQRVALMGGSIAASSKLGVGASFRFDLTLPIRNEGALAPLLDAPLTGELPRANA